MRKKSKDIKLEKDDKGNNIGDDTTDILLQEVHVYSYDFNDPETGVQADGFTTSRMKNTAFIPSSAI